MGKCWWPIKKFSNILIFCLLIFNAKAQSITDFRKEQNKEYTQALVFLELEHWMVDSLECNGINAPFALAIVFPELIRYSAIQNWAETKALEVLYAQYGEAYADFSIGNFQMKPSFAKRLEQDWNTLFSRAQQYRFGIRAFDTLNNQSYRYQRIKRLNDLKSEVKYLLMFILIMIRDIMQLIGYQRKRN